MTASHKAAHACGFFLVALGAAAALPRAYALDPTREVTEYVRDQWQRDREFPGGAVHALAQTEDGYLWIGSERGLFRFDGEQFTPVRDSREHASAMAPVVGLAVGPGGELWVRMPGANLLLYRGGSLQNAVPRRGTGEDAFTSMIALRGGRILLAGLVNGVLGIDGEGVREELAPTLAPRSPVIAMAEAPDGSLWIGTRDGGLIVAKQGRVTTLNRGLPDRKVNCVLPVSDGEIWIGTDRGIARWNGKAVGTAGVPRTLQHVQALAMLKDRAGSLWVGTGSGLWRLKRSGRAEWEASRASTEAATALFEDRDGALWTGSERGLHRLRDGNFVTYLKVEGSASRTSGPVYVDQEGRVWFAPLGGGLLWLHGGNVRRADVAGLAADVVYSIDGGRDGIWLGRRHGGLTHLWLRDGRLESRTFTKADGLPQDGVFSVHESRDGTIWAGSLTGGVSRLRDGRLTTLDATGDAAPGTVASIADDAEGTTWFATPTGLRALSTQGWHTYSTRDGLPSDEVNCLLASRSGVLWIGTGDGLAFRASGRIEKAVVGLSSSEQVFGLGEDAGGWLWLVTSRRVLRVNEADLLAGAGGPVETTEFGREDGLLGVEGIKRERSLVADGLGRIWISTNRGLSAVDPARLRKVQPVSARIVAVVCDGDSLNLRGRVQVGSGRRRLSFRFDGVSLASPERLRFGYRLDGFDRDWHEPTTSREADYTNLPHGSYVFRVRALGLGQRSIGPEATLRLDVAPAFWQRGWVRLVGTLGAALVVAALYKLRVRRITQQLRLRFQERLAERLHIAQELHDTLLQGLTSVSMQLHVVSEQLPADSRAGPLLSRVRELTAQVIDEGRDAVRGLRSARSAPEDLANALSRVPDQIATPSRPVFRVIVEGEPRPLRPVVRDELYRVGREALVNALRHAHATLVEVELEYRARGLRMFVRDDGAGIDPEVLRAGRDGHFGLLGMRERTESIGGRLSVWSAAGAGTEIGLAVRGALAFAGNATQERFRWLRRLYLREKPEDPTHPRRGHGQTGGPV